MKSKIFENNPSSYPYSLHEDYPQFLQKQTCKVQVYDSQFEEVGFEGKQEDESNDEFELEVDEQEPEMKCEQFHSGLFRPTYKKFDKNAALPEIELVLEQFYGFNSSHKNTAVVLSKQIYCLGIGCMLVLVEVKQKAKKCPTRIFLKHNYEICSLYYLEEQKIVVSASKGVKPELIFWRLKAHEKEGFQLEYLNKFVMPRRSIGVGKIVGHKGGVIWSNSISMHQGSSVYSYNTSTLTSDSDPIKFDCMILDLHLKPQNNSLYLATSKGLLCMSQVKSKADYTTVLEDDNLVSVCSLGQNIIVGDKQGNIRIISEGSEVGRVKMLEGWVYHLKQKNGLVSAACGESGQFKILQIDTKDKKVEAKMCMEFNCFVTSVSCFQDYMLLGLRDGSLIMYDCKADQKVFEKINRISDIGIKNNIVMYNKLSEKILTLPYKLLLQKVGLSESLPEIVKVDRCLSCIQIFDDQIIEVGRPAKGEDKVYFCYEVKNITDKLGVASNKEKDKEKGKVLIEDTDEVTAVKFNELVIVFGMKNGGLVVVDRKLKREYRPQTTGLSKNKKQTHSFAVDEIVFQKSHHSAKGSFNLKTIAGSQLFYWEISSKQGGSITRIVSVNGLLNVEWQRITKFSYETKELFEEYPDFQDVMSVCDLEQKYIMVADRDGVMKIYRCPVAKCKQKQYKLFDDGFNVVSCGGYRVCCERRGTLVVFRIRSE